MIAEARDYDPQPFGGFDHLGAGGNLDLALVYDQFGHLKIQKNPRGRGFKGSRKQKPISGRMPLRLFT
jgi:hypothetical protein